MKRVPKHLFDDLVAAERSYWIDHSQDCKRVKEAAIALHKATHIDLISWWDWVGNIIKSNGFIPNATDEEIYHVLNAMGYELIDEN